jgi:hypothetical protein
LHADQAFNNAAEKHMLETIKRAVPLDERRFKLVCPSNADGVDAVHVLSKDLTAVQYVLTDPATRFATCSCPVATQHKACKHQVAWLLSLAPADRKTDAERLVLSCLGTLLGFAGGCTMESIADLSVALKSLRPMAPDLPVREPQPAAAAAAAAECNEGSDGAPGSDDRGCQPRLLGPLALNNHRWELHRLLEECLGALDKADPSMQHSLALQQKALPVRDVSVSVASTAHELRENFATAADITYKRHKSALEHQCQSKRTRTAKHSDQAPLQKKIANVRRDESLLVSKAFRGGRSAKQAAEHIQQCMNTACQKAGAQQHQQQPQDHQPLSQLLQHRPLEQLAPTASHVMPQQRLDLLQEYLMLQDRRRLEAAAASGGVVPRSMLAFGQLPH